ncbi:MAG: SdpI family protein [Pseudomonadota bacterium]
MISSWAKRVAILALATMGAASLAGWLILPADTWIPMHYDATGAVDRYGSLAEGLLLFPAVAAGLFALFLFLARQEPRRDNLKRSRHMLDWSVAGSMALLMVLHLATLVIAAGWSLSITDLVAAGTGLFFVILGNFLPKTRPNFLVGVRTPWTLSSDHSWLRTHVLAGRGFIGLGLLIIASTIFTPAITIYLIVGGSLALAAALTAASWLFWRDDPRRHS